MIMSSWRRALFGRHQADASLSLDHGASDRARPGEPLASEGADHVRQGNALLAQGELERAAECYRHAILVDPKHAQACLNLGYVLAEQKRLDAAVEILEQAVRLDPGLADAFYLLGTLAEARGDLDAAIVAYRKALALKEDFPHAWRDLCRALVRSGQHATAIRMVQDEIARNPDSAELHHFLGNAHLSDGHPEKSLACFATALSIDPDFAEAHNSMGLALTQRGDVEAAIASYRKALAIKPDIAQWHNDLGILLQKRDRLDAAVNSFHAAIALRPDFAEAHGNLGALLHQQHQISAASESYARALSIDPEFAQAHINFGLAYQQQGRLDEAIACYRDALRIRPGNADAISNLLLALTFDPHCSPRQYVAEARRHGAQFAAAATPFKQWNAHPPDRAARPLRVGLVSGDLRAHPVGYFVENVLRHLSGDRIELFGYATNLYEDELTARVKPRFAAWIPISLLSDKAAAQRIHDDGIDVLIDLAGHTAGNRLPVFAWRPAPVQASWLGYFASTGVPGIDYLLADRIAVRKAQEEHFTETLWYLPDTRMCFSPPGASDSFPVTPPPAQRNGHLTFGCFQSLAKLNDAVLASWGRIFDALPSARLRVQNLQFRDPVLRDKLKQRLARAGIAPERVTMTGPTSRDSYLLAHADVDMLLDTFPYPGGTTTCDALWMGVPTITIGGETMLARQGASLLVCAGLGDWVANDVDAYVAMALARAADVDRLTELRSALRARVLASPLFDGPRFARHLEDAWFGMWRQKLHPALDQANVPNPAGDAISGG
jgi:predicted O-linked N-acetylglucosamine transferase (SPINDLY family)